MEAENRKRNPLTGGLYYAEQQYKDPTDLAPGVLQIINSLENKERERELSVPAQTVIVCRLSGLPICKIPSLPWQALPLEIPYSALSILQLGKIQNWIRKLRAEKREIPRESQIFLFYALLAKCPVEFRPRAYLSPNASKWEEIFRRGMTRLYNFTYWYYEQGTRVKANFPHWRIAEDSDFIDTKNNAENFFTILSTWERIKEKFETTGRGYSDYDEETVKAGRADLESALYEFQAVEAARAKKGEILNRFDRRRAKYKEEITEMVAELISFYDIAVEKQGYFLRLAQNPMIMHSDDLEKNIRALMEKGAGRESFSAYHREFIAWLKMNLLSKRTMQRKLEILEEKEIETGNFSIKIEEKLGMPLRKDYKNLPSYLSALRAWKQGQLSVKSVTPTTDNPAPTEEI